MGNLFAGLSSGSQALSYYTRGIETAGHNIANAGVEGFARQRVNTSENIPSYEGGFWIGQGVVMESITRMRDLFLDAQYRAQLPALGYWETRYNNIKNMEQYVGSLDYGTFKDVLNNFWTDTEALHGYPETATVRESMLESAQSVITSLLGMRNSYHAYRTDLNDQVYTMVKDANKLIDDIAKICGEISAAQNIGMNPNDLLDMRDLMAEKLCKLTGATVGSPAIDEADGDYKIELNGRLLVQGAAQYNSQGEIKNARHLVLVPMVGNFGYYDVQIEYNQYDHISDLNVASVVIERGATPPNMCGRDGLHELCVERLSNGKTWMVGGARGQSTCGERIDGIYDSAQALGLDGTFALQVGNAGVQALSKSYYSGDPLKNGVVAADPSTAGGPLEYEFKIAAGSYETYLSMKFDGAQWNFSATNSVGTLPPSAGADLKLEDIANAIEAIKNPNDGYEQAFRARVNADGALTVEASNTSEMRGHLLSITDFRGTLAQDMGIANKNPAVEITVVPEDSLLTIANKINAAYMSDNAAYSTNPPGVAPSSPEEWLHASVVREPDGTYYLALTSDVSGEANRINVLPSEVCSANGNLSIARRLGLVDSLVNDSGTSYMQFNESENAESTIITRKTVGGDVYVNDAYFIYDGSHFLSESNSFADARIFKTQAGNFPNDFEWVNRMADTLDRFGTGVRLNLHGLNTRYNETGSAYSQNGATLIRVEPQLTNGSIFAMIESRDDLILGLEDYLDNMVYEMVTEFNAIHYAGHGVGDNASTTGTAFFEHITSLYGASALSRFKLNDALKKDRSLIAAASGDGNGVSMGEGDWSNALRMAQLKISTVFESGTTDFTEYFQLLMSDLGTQGYMASYMLSAQQSVSDQLQTQRESVMGVNTDEELMDIIKFQQGVGAISRYMTAIDDMLDRIINGMGTAGL